MIVRVSADALVQLRDDAWVISHPRFRHHVELSAAALAGIARFGSGAALETWHEAFRDAAGWDRTIFAGTRGLWADQTGFGPRTALANGAELCALLRRRLFLVDPSGLDERAFDAPLASLIDRTHLGTFHQRVGQHVMVDLRLGDDWRWWHDQKFTPDGLTIRDGPYKAVEEAFFDAYFRDRCAGDRVLDFACGNGHFTARFAGFGADVMGIDTSSELIALARANHGDRARFLAAPDPAASLAAIEGAVPGSFDRIYMGDIVLLLLENGDAFDRLAAAMRRALATTGTLHTMEPNGAFWLAGRYGDPERPYAIVPEYRHATYNVAPTVDRIVTAFARNGFALIELVHPPATARADASLRAFADRYPLWDFCTFVPH